MIVFHLTGTADHYRDNEMLFSHQKHGIDRNFDTEKKAYEAALAFMSSELKGLGDRARLYIEKERHGKRGKIRGEYIAKWERGERSAQNEWKRTK